MSDMNEATTQPGVGRVVFVRVASPWRRAVTALSCLAAALLTVPLGSGVHADSPLRESEFSGDEMSSGVPTAMFFVAVDGDVAGQVELPLPGGDGDEQNGGSSGVEFVGSVTGPDNAWVSTYDVSIVPETTEIGLIEGSMVFENTTNVTRMVTMRLATPMCPLIRVETMTGAESTIQVTLDEGGGQLFVPFGRTGFRGMIDGLTAGEIFQGPFLLTGSGSGILTTSDDYGAPLPSAPSPELTSNVAVEMSFRITGGDKVEFTFGFGVTGAPENFEFCDGDMPSSPLDLNGDGMVDLGDMILLLAQWGPCPGCPADFDQSGYVDLFDLLSILSALA